MKVRDCKWLNCQVYELSKKQRKLYEQAGYEKVDTSKKEYDDGRIRDIPITYRTDNTVQVTFDYRCGKFTIRAVSVTLKSLKDYKTFANEMKSAKELFIALTEELEEG